MKDSKKLWQMFWIFFKIGALTIGGGLAMIGIIEHEFVEKQKWMSREEIVDVFAIVQSLPGVIAINSSIFLGYRLAGLPGAIAAALGSILPSLIIILVIFFISAAFLGNAFVAKAFAGVRAGLVAIIGIAVFKLAKPSIKDVFGIIIAILSFVSITLFKADIALVVIGAGLIGFTYYMLRDYRQKKKGGDGK